MEMDHGEMIQLISQIGIPASMGVVMVWYLIKVIVPRQMETIDRQADKFKDALRSQQDAFNIALTLEQQVHREMLLSVTECIREQSSSTRETLQEVNRSTAELSQAVYKLYGKMGIPNGRSGNDH